MIRSAFRQCLNMVQLPGRLPANRCPAIGAFVFLRLQQILEILSCIVAWCASPPRSPYFLVGGIALGIVDAPSRRSGSVPSDPIIVGLHTKIATTATCLIRHILPVFSWPRSLKDVGLRAAGVIPMGRAAINMAELVLARLGTRAFTTIGLVDDESGADLAFEGATAVSFVPRCHTSNIARRPPTSQIVCRLLSCHIPLDIFWGHPCH